MKNRYHQFVALASACWLLFAANSQAQVCSNVSLSFDGNADFVTLSPTPAAVSGNANFTFEARFTITSPPNPNCGITFRRLFVLSGTSAPGSRFEVGECNNILKLFWLNTTGTSSGVLNIGSTIPVGCHHLAVVRNGTVLQFYLDGVIIPLTGTTGTLTGALNTNIFRVGHWHGNATPGQDWQGEMDEIRLWSFPRTAAEINDFKDCSLTGTSSLSSLMVSWTCDQGANPGGNNTGVMLMDMSGNSNNGTFAAVANGFTLNGSTSNFICSSACSPFYNLGITELYNQSIPLPAICSGDPAHFCVTQNGGIVSPPLGATVMWESFDGTSNVPTLLSLPFTGFNFGVGPGIIDISSGISSICATSSTGFVDRHYRAKITKPSGILTCTYYTNLYNLPIYCPVTNGTVTIAPPVPTGGALCEGAQNLTVSLSSTDMFLNPPAYPTLGGVNIQWCIDGSPVSSLNNMASFPFTGTAVPPDLCFEAKITNGDCPVFVAKTCIPVDPQPVCGTIEGKPSFVPTSLMPDPASSVYDPYDYLICPGDQGGVSMVNPSAFINCNPVWQYHFDTDLAGVWYDLLGTSNSCQLTNTLPQLAPPLSPYLWQSNTTCIYYRIECRPYHYPLSLCVPCTSNVVQICLKPPPVQPVISGPPQICKFTCAQLTVANYDPNYFYTWFCNGVFAGTGQFLTACKNACYTVVASDGCQATSSAPFCLQVCQVVPIIECPSDNPCACAGQPITLDGCSSYYTCAGSTGPLPLLFSWSANTGGAGTQTGPNGCQFIHTPAPGVTTTYTLTVTDPNPLGCTATTTLDIKPCL